MHMGRFDCFIIVTVGIEILTGIITQETMHGCENLYMYGSGAVSEFSHGKIVILCSRANT